MSLISPEENACLDILTDRNIEDLARIECAALDRVLAGLCKRRGRSDAAFRAAAIDEVHPDDLLEAIQGVK